MLYQIEANNLDLILYFFCGALLLICFALFYFLISQRSRYEKKIEIAEQSFLEKENSIESHLSTIKGSFESQEKSLLDRLNDFDNKEKVFLKTIKELDQKLLEEVENRKKILSQKKSGEVRLGHIAETLAPFLDQFDFEPDQCAFLGQPIDYISFGDDIISFIEIKSGESQLSKKQRHIRDLIKSKSIEWKEVRIK